MNYWQNAWVVFDESPDYSILKSEEKNRRAAEKTQVKFSLTWSQNIVQKKPL